MKAQPNNVLQDSRTQHTIVELMRLSHTRLLPLKQIQLLQKQEILEKASAYY